MAHVHLVAGFLEGGKTTFINKLLMNSVESWNDTLVVCCEEGIEEYCKEYTKDHKILMIQEETNLTVEQVKSWEEKYHPEQVIVEYNGMWLMEHFWRTLIKVDWDIDEITVLMDARSFNMYFQNMGEYMGEKLNNADQIYINRCDEELSVSLRARGLQLLNPDTEIFLEFNDGSIEPYLLENWSPVDLNQDIVYISDERFAMWYKDILADPDKYAGKTVHMTLLMRRSPRFPGVDFPGRFAITCCEKDAQFFGLAARGDVLKQFNNRDWFSVTGTIAVEDQMAYRGRGPVLYATAAEPTFEPMMEFVGF